jgi:nitroreductase
MELFEAIYKRRSVRQYTGAPIPKADLLKIVDAGRLAASGSNRQPWEFIIVTDRETIERLKVASLWMEKAAAIVAVVMDPASRWWVEDGSAAVENMLLAATALGYGSCWLEGYTLQREDELKAILNVPAGRRLFTLLPLGVAADWPSKEKKPLESLVYWECYQGAAGEIGGDETP